jgi:hypothetical protein
MPVHLEDGILCIIQVDGLVVLFKLDFWAIAWDEAAA